MNVTSKASDRFTEMHTLALKCSNQPIPNPQRSFSPFLPLANISQYALKQLRVSSECIVLTKYVLTSINTSLYRGKMNLFQLHFISCPPKKSPIHFHSLLRLEANHNALSQIHELITNHSLINYLPQLVLSTSPLILLL